MGGSSSTGSFSEGFQWFSRGIWPLEGQTRATRRHQQRSTRQGSNRLRLGIECLEYRVVPAFLAPVDIVTGIATTASAVGDFNGDGKMDIVTVGTLSGRGLATVLLNDGTGHFTPAASFPTGNTPIDVKVGDLNGDGHLDIVTISSYYTGGLTVLNGNGDGSFQPPKIYTIQTPPTEIQLADVNGDCHLDVVSNNHYFNTVSVFLNDGLGNLGPKIAFAAGGSPASASVADLNGDGKMDIVSTNQASAGTISVQLGVGNGTFLPPTSTLRY